MINYLPKYLRRRIEDRPALQKILSNTGWLFVDRILRMGVGMLVGALIARHLGPEKYGSLSYVLAFVGLFASLSNLGLAGIVVRDLVRSAGDYRFTLGTSLLLRFVGGLISLGVAVFIIGYMRPGDSTMKLMVAIASAVMVFKSSEIVKCWYESRVESKYAVWVEGSVFFVFSSVKLFLVYAGASLISFLMESQAQTLAPTLSDCDTQPLVGGLCSRECTDA